MIALALVGVLILIWVVSMRISTEHERDAHAVDEYRRALECLGAAHAAIQSERVGDAATAATTPPGGEGPWPIPHFRVLRPDEVPLESRRRTKERRLAAEPARRVEGPTWLRPRITVVPPPIRLPVADLPQRDGAFVFGDPSEPEPVAAEAGAAPPALVIPLERRRHRRSHSERTRQLWRSHAQAGRAAAAMAVAMAVGVLAFRAGGSSEQGVLGAETLTERSEAPTTAVAPRPAPRPAAVTLVNQTGDESHYRVATGTVRLTIEASERCWIRAQTADGVTLWEGIIAPGEERVIESPAGLSVRLGLPRAVKLTIGDSPVGVGDGSPNPHTVVFGA